MGHLGDEVRAPEELAPRCDRGDDLDRRVPHPGRRVADHRVVARLLVGGRHARKRGVGVGDQGAERGQLLGAGEPDLERMVLHVRIP